MTDVSTILPEVLAFSIALLLYSAAIWVHRIWGIFNVWIVAVFGIGFTVDACITIYYCLNLDPDRTLSIHAVIGIAAFFLMGLHFTWALLAFHYGNVLARFKKWSVTAWSVWMASYVSPFVPFMMA